MPSHLTRDRYNEGSVRIFTFLLLAPISLAQDRPQFVWQGDIDGTDILYLRAKHLDVQIKEGAPVANQQFHFYDPLPDNRQDARLEVRQGRGYVHIVDQPRLENRYTLAVSIEDRQPGASSYSIALFWDASNRGFEHSGRIDQVTWSGRVDEEALISCVDKICKSTSGRRAPVRDEHYKFSRPLPHRDVEVSLEDKQGRGEIRLVEQPRERNSYTARVSIRDPQSGSGEYSFTLVWTRSATNESLPVTGAEPGMIWRGTVDGGARITIQGRSTFSEAVQRGSIAGERADSLRTLPARSDLHPAVKKLSGRGQVQIVEYPSETNSYRLVFEISDSASGASDYTIEVDW